MESAGTAQQADALQGRGLLQSSEEWEARNSSMAQALCGLILDYMPPLCRHALDVGCADGGLTDRYATLTGLLWSGVDPDVPGTTVSPKGVTLRRARAHQLPYESATFGCVMFANVFEHLDPALRSATLREISRVLTPDGILVGQLPNPYFPIESHSRLPFFGYVPAALRPLYWRLSPTGWDYATAHFFVVGIGKLRRIAEEAGFTTLCIRNFNYPTDAIPQAVRWAARLHAGLGVMPWSWQFAFRRP